MKLSRFNEANFMSKGLHSKEDVVDSMFFKAVYPDLIEDVKEYLDTVFVEFIDKEYEVKLGRVNNSAKGTFFTRYRVNMEYKVADSTDKHYNTIENYSQIMSQVSEDLLNLNSCVTHVKDEYSDESIFGSEFKKNTFETSVSMQMNNGKLIVNFCLDII